MTTTTGTVRQVDVNRVGSHLLASVDAGTRLLAVDSAAPFSPSGGSVSIEDAVYDYTSIDTEADTITLTADLPLALEAGLPVWVLENGGVAVSCRASIDMDDPDAEGVEARVPTAMIGWLSPDRDYQAAPVEVVLEFRSGEWEVVRREGELAQFDGSTIDPATLPPAPLPPLSDGVPPATAPTLTFIGGIGSVFFRWTEVGNADPVTYRLHVRAGEAPTTDGTFEVAAGVGMTAAAVRKLKDDTTVVGDGTVTYYGIVTVEDADGPGPASNAASGVPAQVTSPDIAADAVTADMLIANNAVVDALSGTTITGVTVTGGSLQTAVSGQRVLVRNDVNGGLVEFYSGRAGETVVEAAKVYATVISDPLLMIEAPYFLADVADSQSVVNVKAKRFLVQSRIGGALSGGNMQIDGTSAQLQVSEGVAPRLRLTSTGTAVESGPFSVVTMGSGDVGTGTFRDSVDARVASFAQAGMAVGTATINPTSTTPVTVPGLTLTTGTAATTNATYAVVISADIQILTAGTVCVIDLLRDGVVQSPQIVVGGPLNLRVPGTKEWVFTGVSGVHTWTVRASNTAASTSANVYGTLSSMTIKRIG